MHLHISERDVCRQRVDSPYRSVRAKVQFSIKFAARRWICGKQLSVSVWAYRLFRLSLRILSNFPFGQGRRRGGGFILPFINHRIDFARIDQHPVRIIHRKSWKSEFRAEAHIHMADSYIYGSHRHWSAMILFHIFIRANESIECWARGSDKRLHA